MNGAGIGPPSDPRRFDIDDLAAFKRQGFTCPSDRMNAFIQANRCLQLRLKFRMINEIIIGQRLLDHK